MKSLFFKSKRLFSSLVLASLLCACGHESLPDHAPPPSTDLSSLKPEDNTSYIDHQISLLVQSLNKYLKTHDKEPMVNREILELENILNKWGEKLGTAFFAYCLIFSFIVGHAFINRKYIWGTSMLGIGAIFPYFMWIAPISYTRRNLFVGNLSQQIPFIIIQILPTFVGWAFLSELVDWSQRLHRARGLLN